MNISKPISNYVNFLNKQNIYDLFCFSALSVLASWSLFRVSYQVLQNQLPSHATPIERFCCTPSPIVFSHQMYIDDRIFNIFFVDGSSQISTKGELVEKISHFYFRIFFRHYFQIPYTSNKIKAEAGLRFFFCDSNIKNRFGFSKDIKKIILTTVFKNPEGSKIEQQETAEALCQ